MEITTLREKLHTLIDNSTDDKLRAIFHFLQDEEEYSDAFKSELDAEFASYQKEGEGISKDEIDKMVEQLLHGQK